MRNLMRSFVLSTRLFVCLFTIFLSLDAVAKEAVRNGFSIVKIDCDGTSHFVIEKADKYDLSVTVNDNTTKHIEIKDGVLYISCKRKEIFDSVNVRCVLKLPKNVNFVRINAGNSVVAVNGYSGKLKISSGTLDLSVATGLAGLRINTGTLTAEIKNFVNEADINAGTSNIKFDIAQTAGQKVKLNSATCNCTITLPKNSHISYDVTGLMKVKSDFPNYADTAQHNDCSVKINCASGKLILSSK